jgi:hypothetical protein
MARKLPGRIVGQTEDREGKRGFVLTLQAREQHIRREKASSNICSNQALCALTAAVYMSAMGEQGMKQAAINSTSKAHYLAKELTKLDGVELVYNNEFFHEFTTTLPKCDEVLLALENNGILGGYKTENGVIWCVTEVVTKAEQNVQEIRELKQTIEKMKAKEFLTQADQFLLAAKEISGLKVLSMARDGITGDDMRKLGDFLRDKASNIVALIASVNEGKITFLATCGKDAVAKGVKAGDIIKTIAPICGGKGGGKPDSAMGGGSDVLKLDDALAALDNFVAEKVQ